MDSFELNKIMGAILGTCLFTLVLSIAAGDIFAPHLPAKAGYEIAVKEEAAGGKPEAAEPTKSFEDLVASASVDKGKASAKKCEACHSLEKNGPNKVGPDLYGVVDRDRAAHAGFNYSAAMKAKGGKWTYDDLYQFIKNPKAFLPGTAMGFAGISKDSERADLLVYLRTLSDSPVPLPTASN